MPAVNRDINDEFVCKPPAGYSHNGAPPIPDRMGEPLERWVKHRERPGHFLSAVLANDLSNAVGYADAENLRALASYVGWLYNEAPGACWGSAEKVAAWAAGK